MTILTIPMESISPTGTNSGGGSPSNSPTLSKLSVNSTTCFTNRKSSGFPPTIRRMNGMENGDGGDQSPVMNRKDPPRLKLQTSTGTMPRQVPQPFLPKYSSGTFLKSLQDGSTVSPESDPSHSPQHDKQRTRSTSQPQRMGLAQILTVEKEDKEPTHRREAASLSSQSGIKAARAAFMALEKESLKSSGESTTPSPISPSNSRSFVLKRRAPSIAALSDRIEKVSNDLDTRETGLKDLAVPPARPATPVRSHSPPTVKSAPTKHIQTDKGTLPSIDSVATLVESNHVQPVQRPLTPTPASIKESSQEVVKVTPKQPPAKASSPKETPSNVHTNRSMDSSHQNQKQRTLPASQTRQRSSSDIGRRKSTKALKTPRSKHVRNTLAMETVDDPFQHFSSIENSTNPSQEDVRRSHRKLESFTTPRPSHTTSLDPDPHSRYARHRSNGRNISRLSAKSDPNLRKTFAAPVFATASHTLSHSQSQPARPKPGKSSRRSSHHVSRRVLRRSFSVPNGLQQGKLTGESFDASHRGHAGSTIHFIPSRDGNCDMRIITRSTSAPRAGENLLGPRKNLSADAPAGLLSAPLSASTRSPSPHQLNLPSSATLPYPQPLSPHSTASMRSEKARMIQKLSEQLLIEQRLKQGAEMMLQAQQSASLGETISREQVIQELNFARGKIGYITKQLEYYRGLPELGRIPTKVQRRWQEVRDRNVEKDKDNDDVPRAGILDVAAMARKRNLAPNTRILPHDRRTLSHDPTAPIPLQPARTINRKSHQNYVTAAASADIRRASSPQLMNDMQRPGKTGRKPEPDPSPPTLDELGIPANYAPRSLSTDGSFLNNSMSSVISEDQSLLPPDFSFPEFFSAMMATPPSSEQRLEALNSYSHLISLGYHRLHALRTAHVQEHKIEGNFEAVEFDAQVQLLRDCLSDRVKEIRASAYRCIRYLVQHTPSLNPQVYFDPTASRSTSTSDATAVERIMEFHISFFMIRSLNRDHQKLEVEREQVLKLIRLIVSVEGGAQGLPEALVRMVVAIAEHVDDRLRTICLATICQLSIKNMALVVKCSGLKCMTQALVEEPKEYTDLIIMTLLYLLDNAKSRKYFRPGVDVEIVVASLTDIYNKKEKYEERLSFCTRAIQSILRSWTGLIYLSMNGKQAICAIVEALRLPVEQLRTRILDMLFSIFRIEVPHWLPDAMSSKAFAQNISGIQQKLRKTLQEKQSTRKPGPLPYTDRLDLVNHFTAFLLQVFIEAGLLESLIQIIRKCESQSGAKATILIAEIINLANTYLPKRFANYIQSVPSLFQMASSFEELEGPRTDASQSREKEDVSVSRHNAILALAHIDNMPRAQSGSSSYGGLSYWGNHVQEAQSDVLKVTEGYAMQRQLELVKLKMGYHMEDTNFRNLLTSSNIPQTKDFTRWNWDITRELLLGPLRNPKRLEEVMSSTSKFIKRLLSFFRPSRKQFSEIRLDINRHQYVSVGSALFDTLLRVEAGRNVLRQHPFLKELEECLSELDTVKGPTPKDVTFSREAMENSLTKDYFTLLGVLTKSKEGVDLLEYFQIFTKLYHISSLRSRDDVIRTLIQSMDYSLEGHCRIILSKVMTSSYKHIRLFATNHLCTVLRSGQTNFSEWGVPLLITQLYDPKVEVCHAAVLALDEACNDEKNLHTMIGMAPTLDHLGEIGSPLFLRFLRTPEGFHYLSRLGYVEREMDNWFRTGNINYVVRLELTLYKAMTEFRRPKYSSSIFAKRIRSSEGRRETAMSHQLGDASVLKSTSLANANVINSRVVNGLTPPHFYGELTKTEAGCALLRSRGHFQSFVHFLDHVLEHGVSGDMDEEATLRLKAVLWAVGTIGATSMGISFLEEHDIVRKITQIAEVTDVFSVKGTCFHILGLISMTDQGAEILEELGWDRGPCGVCLPIKSSQFLRTSEWEFAGVVDNTEVNNFKFFVSEDTLERDIMKGIGNMSNHILANTTFKQLMRMRQEHAEYFQRPKLLLGAMFLLGSYHYRLTAHRYIHDMFKDASLADFQTVERVLRRFESSRSAHWRSSDFALSYVEEEVARGSANEDDGANYVQRSEPAKTIPSRERRSKSRRLVHKVGSPTSSSVGNPRLLRGKVRRGGANSLSAGSVEDGTSRRPADGTPSNAEELSGTQNEDSLDPEMSPGSMEEATEGSQISSAGGTPDGSFTNGSDRSRLEKSNSAESVQQSKKSSGTSTPAQDGCDPDSSAWSISQAKIPVPRGFKDDTIPKWNPKRWKETANVERSGRPELDLEPRKMSPEANAEKKNSNVVGPNGKGNNIVPRRKSNNRNPENRLSAQYRAAVETATTGERHKAIFSLPSSPKGGTRKPKNKNTGRTVLEPQTKQIGFAVNSKEQR